MSSNVTAKLLYDEKKFGDIPVWEIITNDGNQVYYERDERPGLRPIGNVEKFTMGSYTLSVFPVAKPFGAPVIYRIKDGYVAPDHWYLPINV